MSPPSYPSVGCFPAEPAAVSPGKIIVPRIVVGGVILSWLRRLVESSVDRILGASFRSIISLVEEAQLDRHYVRGGPDLHPGGLARLLPPLRTRSREHPLHRLPAAKRRQYARGPGCLPSASPTSPAPLQRWYRPELAGRRVFECTRRAMTIRKRTSSPAVRSLQSAPKGDTL
jgi:hypothetical protein